MLYWFKTLFKVIIIINGSLLLIYVHIVFIFAIAKQSKSIVLKEPLILICYGTARIYVI
jgi:hypothetical protein